MGYSGTILFPGHHMGGLEVNTEKIKYMVTACHQNAGQKSQFTDRKLIF
jgi:hypothetical protein